MQISEKLAEKLLLWIESETTFTSDNRLLFAYDFIDQYMYEHGFFINIHILRELIYTHSKNHKLLQLKYTTLIESRLKLFVDIL